MMWKFREYTERIAALDDAGQTITYGELAELSEQFAKICKRNLVFLMAHNSLGSFAGYAAMIQGGVVSVMLSDDLDMNLRTQLITTYQPEFYWIPKEMENEFSFTEVLLENYGYLLVRSQFKEGSRLFGELALLLTTSGSTGSPKLVRQSYQNIKSNTQSIAQYLELDSTERPITTLPMNYTYGLSIINSHLWVGATMLITDKTLMQREFWDFFKKEKATSFGGVPYTYEILKKLRFFRMDLPSLRTMTQAGGKLIPELHREYAEYALSNGKKFVVMYGQTEASPRMAYLPAEKALEKAGSMGIAIPGGQFRLLDVDGYEIKEADVVGELEYRGENVTLGYAECREDLAKGDERFGCLLTGDMAKKDSEGYYYIVGRKKRFLKMYGKRVNLDEIERMVKTQFEPLDCACDGVDDHMYLFVNDEAFLGRVRDFICEKTHINSAGIQTRYLNVIPKNNAGKTLYAELRQYYDEL